MTTLLRIADRVLNRPLLIHPDKVPLILSVLQGRIPVGDVSAMREEAEQNISAMPEAARRVMRGGEGGYHSNGGPGASQFVGSDEEVVDGKRKWKPYRMTAAGTAIITITGSLVNRGAWIGSNSGTTSYEGIGEQVKQAGNDPKVRSILFDIESPGGEAVGAFEAADIIRAVSEKKRTVAVVNGMAASAAYALASGARKIITTPTGMVGSIGVVMMHADYSRALDAAGVTPTFIYAGKHKVDGNPTEPLAPEVRDDMQAEVDKFYKMFVQTVAAGRKGATADAIRKTEARVFMGKDAVPLLADAVGTFESVLNSLERGYRL